MSGVSRDAPNEEQLELLHDLYYNQGVLFGRDRLYKYVSQFYPEYNISRRMVWWFLSRQETHQRFQQVKRTRDIQNTVLSTSHKQLGIDLIDMSNYEYKNFKYILTCIDMFSKKAYAEALPNKEAITVAKAMEKIIDDQIFYVSSIRSDNGSEFIAKEFKEMLAKYNIKQVLSLPGKPQSNGQIERFNRTLKRALIIGMQIQGNNNWVKILPQFVQNYNDSMYRVFKVLQPKNKVSSVTYFIQNGKEKLKQKYYNNDLLYVPGIQNKLDDPEYHIVSKIIKPSKNATRRKTMSQDMERGEKICYDMKRYGGEISLEVSGCLGRSQEPTERSLYVRRRRRE